MVERAASITHAQPAPAVLHPGIPTQRTRGGQPDLRRVTLPPPASSLPLSVPDPPADGPSRVDEPSPLNPERIPRPDDWLNSHRPLIIGCDAVVIIFAVVVAQLITFDINFNLGFSWSTEGFAWLVGIVVAVSWLVLLAVEGVWDTWVLRNSRSERRRILLASLMVFAGVGIVGYLTMADPARTYLLIVAPLGMTGLVVNHWFWHRRFTAFCRSQGRQHGAVTVGDLGAGALCDRLPDGLDSGYQVSGVLVLRDQDSGSGPGASDRDTIREIPDRSDRTGTVGAAASSSDAVAVVNPRLFGPDRPPVPTLSRRQAFTKRTLDLTVAVVCILLLAPLLVAAAVMVVLADGDPVLHLEECVGRRGKAFKRWTFRCTPYGAKARPALVGEPAGRARRAEYDVATTSIGRLLRRTGLACAPGLFNVLAGQMSVVGPKPAAPGDVTAHPVTVRPGLTGPWRLDVRYHRRKRRALYPELVSGRRCHDHAAIAEAGRHRKVALLTAVSGLPYCPGVTVLRRGPRGRVRR